jgi:tetratricopeptide (TPR) repeat protein
VRVAVALDTLVDAHLLESPAPDRFRLHDLLRSYAAELLTSTEAAGLRNAALGRLLHWYAEQAVIAARTLAPGRELQVIVPVSAAPVVTEPSQAYGWFEAELASLSVAASQAAGLGDHQVTVQIALAMGEYFLRAACLDRWLTVSAAGVAGARRLGNDAALSTLLACLGWVSSELNRFGEASSCFAEALRIQRRTGDVAGQAMILNCLGVNLWRQDQPDQALVQLRQALDMLTAAGDRAGIGVVLINMAIVLRRLERYEEAQGYLENAAAIQARLGDRFRASIVETTLGLICLDLGRYEEAVTHCRSALASFDGPTHGNRDKADALRGLGDALAQLGCIDEARQAWQNALPILDRLHDEEAGRLRQRLASTS